MNNYLITYNNTEKVTVKATSAMAAREKLKKIFQDININSTSKIKKTSDKYFKGS